VEQLKVTLGFDFSFVVSSTGRSGGLGIFWRNNINLQILPYSQYHIDAERIKMPKRRGKLGFSKFFCEN
jgi:hypothetical protein